jgi:hypothetical protein
MIVKPLRKLHIERREGTWHVFNGKCQVAGPYPSEVKAMEVRDDMERNVVIWNGKISECQLCGKKLNGVMIDARLKRGSWANVCQDCHNLYGVGLGTGNGQRYEWSTEHDGWIKTEG